MEPTLTRIPLAILAAALLVPLAPAAARSEPSPGRPPADSWLVALVKPGATVRLHARPGGKVLARVARRTRFGSARVFTVFRRRGVWLGVSAAEFPNDRLAWIDARRGLYFRRTRLALYADLSERRLELRRGDAVLRSVTVGIGRPPSTTPTGRFGVTDKLRGARYGSYYGCCILAISGNQPNLPPGWFGGSRLAVHGTSAPPTIGKPSSAGCLRASRLAMLYLSRRVPLGTPVFIRP